MIKPFFDYTVDDWRADLVKQAVIRAKENLKDLDSGYWDNYTVRAIVIEWGYLQRLNQEVPHRAEVDEVLKRIEDNLKEFPTEGYGSIGRELERAFYSIVPSYCEHQLFELKVLTSPFAINAGYPELYEHRLQDIMTGMIMQIDFAALCREKCKEFGNEPTGYFAELLDSHVKGIIEAASVFQLAAPYIKAQYSLLDPSATHMQATYPMWNALMEAVCSN